MTSRAILLVEDNPMDLELTLRAFAATTPTPTVEVARDGEEALAWIPRWRAGTLRPAVVLLDLKLPKVNGIEVLQAFSSEPISAAIPLVVLSTSVVDADVAAAYAAGARSYLQKPIDYDAFTSMIATFTSYWTALNRYRGK